MSTYQNGVDMFVRTLATKYRVDLSAKPPKWATIESKVTQAIKKHRAKMNKEKKATGTGDEDGEPTSDDEQAKFYDDMLALYTDWQEQAEQSKKQRKENAKKKYDLTSAGRLSQHVSIGKTAQAMLEDMKNQKENKDGKDPGKRISKKTKLTSPLGGGNSKAKTLAAGLQVLTCCTSI